MLNLQKKKKHYSSQDEPLLRKGYIEKTLIQNKAYSKEKLID